MSKQQGSPELQQALDQIANLPPTPLYPKPKGTLAQALIHDYLSFYNRHAVLDEEVWKVMTNTELAGYFIICYGLACGNEHVHLSNEGTGDAEGWEDFPGSDKQREVAQLIAQVMEEM